MRNKNAKIFSLTFQDMTFSNNCLLYLWHYIYFDYITFISLKKFHDNNGCYNRNIYNVRINERRIDIHSQIKVSPEVLNHSYVAHLSNFVAYNFTRTINLRQTFHQMREIFSRVRTERYVKRFIFEKKKDCDRPQEKKAVASPEPREKIDSAMLTE